MKRILDTETGEVVCVKSERFTKSMVEVWRHMNKKNILTTAEEKIIHRLSMYLQLNTNAIVTPNGEYMNIERIAVEIGVDRHHTRKVVNGLMQKNALGMWKSGSNEIYYMNPFLFQSGEINSYLYSLFDAEYHRQAKANHNIQRLRTGKKVTSIVEYKAS